MKQPLPAACNGPPRLLRRRLSRWTAAVFVLALIMGPGPGAYLITSADGDAPATVLGLPILYAWTAFWFLVMAGCILFSAWKVWPKDDAGEEMEQRG